MDALEFIFPITADWCREHTSASGPEGGEWVAGTTVANRFVACWVNQYQYDSNRCTGGGDGAPPTCTLDEVSFRSTVIAFGGAGSRVVTFLHYLDDFSFANQGRDFTIQASMDCHPIPAPPGDCQISGGAGQPGTGSQWQAAEGTYHAQFDATSDPAQGVGTAAITWADADITYTINGSAATAAFGIPFRFDSNAEGTWIGSGAVFPEAIPTLRLDRGDAAITQSASHVYDALYNTAITVPADTSGNPKTIPGLWGNFLTRADSNNPNNGANHTAACVPQTRWAPPDYSGGTAAASCDEFPFNSTNEGAALTAGTSTPKFSVRMILANDNTEEGRRLSGFYPSLRILDGDEFAVDPYGTPPPPAGAAYAVVNVSDGGSFADAWYRSGGAAGPLGNPTGNWTPEPGGRVQHFAGGDIHWSSAGGTHALYGATFTDFTNLGGLTSSVGFPTGDILPAANGGTQTTFAGTSCTVAGITGTGSAILAAAGSSTAAEMQGCIYQAYEQRYNGPAGTYGYPATDEAPMAGGRVSEMLGSTCGTDSGSALYWNGAVHGVYGCIYQKYKTAGEAAGSLGFPTGDAFSITNGTEQQFQHGYITDVGGVTSTQPWIVGHAAHAGNDYPYETVGQFEHQDQGIDAWDEYYGQCDSFAAWKVYENLAGTPQHPTGAIPSVGWKPSNANISPVDQFTWGNADIWKTKFQQVGYAVDNIPTPGAIAWWPNAVADPQDNNPPDPVHGLPGSNTGHVAYVTDVYPDGSITIEQYNMRLNGEYSVAHLNYNAGYNDTSFNHSGYSVPWPGGFIHVADGPAGGAASPPEPAAGVVSATYPTQVKVIGPGSPSSQFTTQNVWYSDPGIGEVGTDLYTHTNGATADSTATWTPSGLVANSCYRVDALVPNQFSNNAHAIYTITDSSGTKTAAVNENDYTSNWAELGIFQTTSAGALTVRLDDRGDTGYYVSADAMRFWPQPCAPSDQLAAMILPPTSTGGTWTSRSGHGFFGTDKSASTSGSQTLESSYADWTVTLLPNTCYDVAAYVPDVYSDQPGARYQVLDGWYANGFFPQVNENSFTNQFASIGVFRTTTSGSLWVELSNEGPGGLFVGADALAFTVNPDCAGLPTRSTPSGAVLAGLANNSSTFYTTGNWNSGIGHGFYNHDLWIPTVTSGAATSTAVWNVYHLATNACYKVEAWIPANYFANNQNAVYDVTVWNGSFGAGGEFPLNQNSVGDVWANLGTITTQDGHVSVTLGNTGTTGSYTAADELAFVRC